LNNLKGDGKEAEGSIKSGDHRRKGESEDIATKEYGELPGKVSAVTMEHRLKEHQDWGRNVEN